MLIYDTKNHEKREFIPAKQGEIRMYVCGPTVYDRIHIGNARTFLSFDVIRRWLMHSGYTVTFAQNITDIDDKIINRANETNVTSKELASEYTDKFIADMRAFNVLDPDIRPCATNEIDTMIDMIETLIEKDHAYQAEGDVYFSVRSDEDYGKLSNRDINELKSGARVESSDIKHDPLDFALWKKAKENEPSWDSPWGQGRPGWHTECAAMAHKYLGTPLDIHGGGSDLSFPHHENESAQARCAWGENLANYWMHTGMLLVDGEKMSKSLGNFYTLHEVLEKYSADALRLLMLQTHYRSALDFSFERLNGAENSLSRIRSCVRNLLWAADESRLTSNNKDSRMQETANKKFKQAIDDVKESVAKEMADDFNTAGALGSLFTLVTEANNYLVAVDATQSTVELTKKAADYLIQIYNVFGINVGLEEEQSDLPDELVQDAKELCGVQPQSPKEAAQSLLLTRDNARKNKNWELADAIRDRLTLRNLQVEDTAQGARVVRRSE